MDKKKIVGIIIAVLTAIALLLGVYSGYQETGSVDTNKITEAIETVINVIDNQSSTEIPELKAEDEQILEVQEENEGLEEQGEIAYNGDYISTNLQIGEYAGLTYYSQIDYRWKDYPYTSIGDYSQTVGTSGCGPTSAAMVVSSIRGTITPDTMADLFLQNGYRSANSGTYLAAFRWTADFFNIEYNHTTDIYTVVDYLNDNNYVIASCGSGLFTYGGHLIVIYGIEGDTLKIYDPYLYSGKFDTSTRRNKVIVDGNTIYCSIDNFKYYSGATNFYCYKNDRTDIKDNNTQTTIVEDKSEISNEIYKVKVTARSGLNIRSGASTSYSKIGGYSYNTIVTILAQNNNWGKTDKGWICLDYTSKISNSVNYPNYLIKRGQISENVRIVQKQLINFGYNCGYYGADSIFGKDTYNAVVKFQRNNGLSPDGIVGPLTWNKLF